MILFILFLFLFAHEDLPSIECKKDQAVIGIEHLKSGGYKIKTPSMKMAKTFKNPKVEDFFDPEKKQVFDTYTFSEKDFKLVVKRPETKGPIKNMRATWKSIEFHCK